jgi:hypothetical protein
MIRKRIFLTKALLIFTSLGGQTAVQTDPLVLGTAQSTYRGVHRTEVVLLPMYPDPVSYNIRVCPLKKETKKYLDLYLLFHIVRYRESRRRSPRLLPKHA